MVKILMVSGKMATPALLNRSKGYYVIYSVYDVTGKFCHMSQIILWMWSCDQNLVALAFV